MSSDRSAVLYPRSDAEGLGLWLENNYHMSMLFRYDGPIVSRRVVASIDSGLLCAYRLVSFVLVEGGDILHTTISPPHFFEYPAPFSRAPSPSSGSQ